MAAQRVNNKNEQENTIADCNAYGQKNNRTLPIDWPRDHDGSIVTHAWRVIDADEGSDLMVPELAPTVQHLFEAGKPVDFAHKKIKKMVFEQIDKVSDGNVMRRPFLSVSLNLNRLVPH